ncbi:hypothetical protein HT136_03320 [Novosphingobium profundi]|uniref:hypothetical protein n=1 Tax=Novosphingobium profundi TaxID=1774954 RepID=UPI001BDB62CC|nr:hypothetical protein [Novosphingobium profundi]MBT0667395.1 hypothetical protein [Novosphingobium profundi]
MPSPFSRPALAWALLLASTAPAVQTQAIAHAAPIEHGARVAALGVVQADEGFVIRTKPPASLPPALPAPARPVRLGRSIVLDSRLFVATNRGDPKTARTSETDHDAHR